MRPPPHPIDVFTITTPCASNTTAATIEISEPTSLLSSTLTTMNYSAYLAVLTKELDRMKMQWLLMAETMQAMTPPRVCSSPEHLTSIEVKHSADTKPLPATAHTPPLSLELVSTCVWWING